MAFRIVRNDITKMNTEAIVNTANSHVAVGAGCDSAVYNAAGYNTLLQYREEKIGFVPEGDAFITPGFNLQANYIIHAVSPIYLGGDDEEEEKLRSCYRKSLQLAKENDIKSISFPLISTGGFGYPKEEGMRIAVDEINAFLLNNDMEIYLVVFDDKSTKLGVKIFPELEAFIDHNYVREASEKEYIEFEDYEEESTARLEIVANAMPMPMREAAALWDEDSIEELESKLNERLAHRADTFSEYLLYLIKSKNMTNVEVYKRACLTKQYFHKINKNKDFHPEKIKALLLCIGAQLNLDETKDLLARAGYALSPSDLTDIIFTFFIEHKHYDVIDIDIQLEEHGLPCIIT